MVTRLSFRPALHRLHGAGTIALTLAMTLLFSGAHTTSHAVSASPELLRQLRESGELQKFVDRMAGARAKGVWSPGPLHKSPKAAIGKLSPPGAPAAVDTLRVLVILVDFDDNPASGGVAYGQPADFQPLLFSVDQYDGHYSLTEFYSENSYGSFFLQGQVVGWYRMPQTYGYYVDGQNGWGPYPRSAQKMVEDAVLAADPNVNYSQFDADGNGEIDGLFVVHAGPGAEETGSDHQIWSHMSGLYNTLYLDGTQISLYSTEPEEMQSLGLITFGIFAHEYGHVIGLPDLYDGDYSSAGIGDWSLMSFGSWNYNGRFPAFLDAWCKAQLGFLTPTNIASNQVGVSVPTSYADPVAFRVWENGQVGPEYFLVENRRKSANDKGIPGSGLLIMHIDETIWGNWDETHPLVAVEQADGLFHLENDANQGDANDVWSQATKPDFDDLSTPNTRMYSGLKTRTAVWNISAADSVMTAGFDIFYSRPRFELLSGVFSDSAFGNNNGIAEEGETITFYFVVRNLWATATNVAGTLSADNNDITFIVPSVNIGAVPGEGGTAANLGNLLQFSIPAGFAPCIDSFRLDLTSDNPNGAKTFGLELHIGKPSVLIVDDDNGGAWEDYLEAEMYARRMPFDVYDKLSQGSPSAAVLNGYEVVMWLTGDARSDILSAADVAAMTSFMDSGGNFFLTGQSIVKELNTENQSFLNNYLRATYVADGLYPNMNGQAGSPIGNGLKLRLRSGSNQTNPQKMAVANGSVADFVYPIGGVTALSYAGSYKLVLLSFGFEGIANEYVANGYASRDTLLGRILSFFLAGTGSLNPIISSAGIEGEGSLQNVIGHTPTFVWSVDDTTPNPISSYEITVGTGELCYNRDNMWSPGPFTGSDTSVSYSGSPLVDGETYLFAARVNNGVTWSNWRRTAFRMNSVGSPGVLFDPAWGEQAASATPALNVYNATDPDGDVLTYDFQVYDDPALTSLVASGTGVAEGSGQTSWIVTSTLSEDGTYYWRSRTFDSYEYSSYTTANLFYINAVNQLPSAFDLMLPALDSLVTDSFPRLVWQKSVDGDMGDSVTYTLWTSLDQTFGTYTQTAGLPDTFRTLTYLLEIDTLYYWKVKAVDRSGSLTWSSQTYRFHTPSAGCCVGARGNVDGDPGDNVNVADLTFLVDYLFAGGQEPPCPEETNIDGGSNGQINVADLTYLVAFLFQGGIPPAACP
ncbi:MAG TPA: M6 family metalloprotease domain-containing protein [Candidatus Deferrimicrobium sp.]|nr:M6 family metalloprotease domain-containing protein [Candidatus Deferrimicrobium sp.]